jgi:hypothetical protein
METMANVTHQKTVLAALRNGPLSIEKLTEKTGLSHRQVAITCNILRRKGRLGTWRPGDELSRQALELLRDRASLQTPHLAHALRELAGRPQGRGTAEIPTQAVYDFFKALERAGLVTAETKPSTKPKLFVPRLRSVVHRGNYQALAAIRKIATERAAARGLRRDAEIPPDEKEFLLAEYAKTLDALADAAPPSEKEEIAQLKAPLLATLRGTTFTDVLLLFGVRLFHPQVVEWSFLPSDAVCDLQGDPMKAPRLRVQQKEPAVPESAETARSAA